MTKKLLFYLLSMLLIFNANCQSSGYYNSLTGYNVNALTNKDLSSLNPAFFSNQESTNLIFSTVIHNNSTGGSKYSRGNLAFYTPISKLNSKIGLHSGYGDHKSNGLEVFHCGFLYAYQFTLTENINFIVRNRYLIL